jgi:hypothetical protein
METAVVVSLATGGTAGLIGLHAAYVSRRALAVSKKALAWQQERDRERQETRLVVQFDHEARAVPTDDRATWLMGGPENLPLDYVLTLVVYNAGETTESISDLFLEDAEQTKGCHIADFLQDHVLRPRERIARSLTPEQLPFDTAGGIVGRARLASGKEVASEVAHLDPVILEAVRERNTRGCLDAPPPLEEQMPDVTRVPPQLPEIPEPPQR